MKIEHKLDTLLTTIRAEDIVSWKNGTKAFYDLPKHDRPDWNLYEYFGNGIDPVNKLYELGQSFGINKCPQEVVEVIDTAKRLAKIYDDYMSHALAVCLEQRGKIQ